MSDSVRPHGLQPTRLLCPWDSPGKNTRVGCHFLLQCMKVESESEVAQSCPTPSDPMDCSLPGSSIHGIFWTTVLEWGAIAFYHSFNDIFLNIIFYCLFTLLLENMIPVKHLSLFPNVSYQCYSFLILILFYHLIGLYVSYSFYHATSSKTVS